MLETITKSKCCKANFDYKENERNEIEIYICNKCDQICEVEDLCEFCLGDGVVDTDETDSDGNVARGVGSAKCICQIHDEDGDYDEQ